MYESLPELLEDYLEVHRRKDNELTAHCPFGGLHKNGYDKTPSFSINVNTGLWMCRGCGSKGNLRKLLKVFGMKRTMRNFYARKFQKDDEDYDEIKEYLPLPPDSGFSTYLLDRGFTQDALDWFGIYYHCTGTAVIPVYDLSRLVGYQERVLKGGDAKYLSSFPDGVFFALGRWGATVYHTRLILVEGALDCVWMHQHGYFETISGFSSSLSNAQIKRLQKSPREVWIAFDGDEAGKRASEELSKKLPKAKVVRLPEGRDVQELDPMELEVLFNA
jgi:DNA primase